MSKLVAAVGNRSVPTQEMRKQAANLVGKIVVTGQESVQGSRRPMRKDIYKKHISADKVPERLCYTHCACGAPRLEEVRTELRSKATRQTQYSSRD